MEDQGVHFMLTTKAFLKIATTSLVIPIKVKHVIRIALGYWFLFSDTQVCQSNFPWKVTTKVFFVMCTECSCK